MNIDRILLMIIAFLLAVIIDKLREINRNLKK